MNGLIFGMLLMVFGLTSAADDEPKLVEVQIEIRGCESDAGKVRLGIYNSAAQFPNPSKQWKGIILDAQKGVVIYKMQLPKDAWMSFAAFHDENENGKMDKNVFGAPTEIYGFSRNARGTFSAPDYKDAVVKITGEKIVFDLR